MPGSENQVVKIRLVAEGNQMQNESNFYYLENSTAAWPRSEISTFHYGIGATLLSKFYYGAGSEII
ncbi:MAG: hypothetical protein A2Y98_02685 [Candidatus Portnoybacteria bacterium RBG_19FT_COMBO_36_7]|uniref:Uncharacterized protein n=1 Tax=Candidatus Portnoybacteria bacterium RBG_19FT_COMBO_36_7 TaxID=1801992 RepID=A0A1G2F6V2_9BACT|nr:MAG: hypothetical protein A2Y98_02685 [Candidatus Portnoybacteria bacterium RBG_19FT_COMBO_36_7]